MSSRSFTLHGPPANHAADPPSEQPGDANQSMTFDIVDAHGLIRNLSIQSQRLSRQFQKSLAALLKLHKHKGMHFEPADLGFVFSKEEIERFAHRAREPLAASAHRSAAGCL